MEAQRRPGTQPRTQASNPSSFPSERQADIPSTSTRIGFWGVLPPTRVRKKRQEMGRGDGMVAGLPGALSFCVPRRMLGRAGRWWAMNHGCLWGWWQSPCRGKGCSHLRPPQKQALFQIHNSCPLPATPHLAQGDDLMYVSAWKPHGGKLTSSPGLAPCFPHSGSW